MYNTMEYTEHVMCNISNSLVALALEWGRSGELLLALMVKDHDVSEIFLKISCVPKALSTKDDRNLFYLNRIINQTSHVWAFIYY